MLKYEVVGEVETTKQVLDCEAVPDIATALPIMQRIWDTENYRKVFLRQYYTHSSGRRAFRVLHKYTLRRRVA